MRNKLILGLGSLLSNTISAKILTKLFKSHYLTFNNEDFINIIDYIGTNDGAVVNIPTISATTNTITNMVNTNTTLVNTWGSFEIITKRNSSDNPAILRFPAGISTNNGFRIRNIDNVFAFVYNGTAYVIEPALLFINTTDYYLAKVEYDFRLASNQIVITVKNLTTNITYTRTINYVADFPATPFYFGSVSGFNGITPYCKITAEGEVVGEWICVESGGGMVYDVSGNNNHATINTIYSAQAWNYSQSIKNFLPTRGYELYENGLGGIIQVPYRNFEPFQITPTIAGYTKTRDIDIWGGGINMNNSTIDFNPSNTVSPPFEVELFNRNNIDIYNDLARENFNPLKPYGWLVAELTLNNINNWLNDSYKKYIYVYNKFIDTDVVAISDIAVSDKKIFTNKNIKTLNRYFNNQRNLLYDRFNSLLNDSNNETLK